MPSDILAPAVKRTASVRPTMIAGLDADQVWDIVTRIVNVTWVAALLLGQMAGLVYLASSTSEGDIALRVSGLTARLASIMFLCVFAVGVVARARRVGQSTGIVPRVVALAGSFIPTFAFLLPRAPEAVSINIASSLMCALGFGLAAYAFTHLNRSVSIMPEARSLVTSGPYAFVRHPVYLFEAIGIAGIFLPFEPLWAVPIYLVQFCCQLQRMRYEERVLTDSFPEYAAYAARTPRLIPRFF
jgi:protein-S-isoprenylcysteine O-methyltransferase Ste14